MADRAAREDARARPPLRERAARAGHGPQGLRAGHERGHPARHPRRLDGDARRALGLRLRGRGRRGVRPRRGRRVRGRGGLRHLLRRAVPAHAPHPGGRRAEEEGPGRRPLPGHPRRRREPGPDPALGRGDGPHAARRRALGGREGLGGARRPRADRGGRADEGRPARGRLRPGPGPHARRGGNARLRQPLPGGAGGGGGARPGGGRGVRLERRRRRHLHPLRLTGLRPSNRHGGAPRDARRGSEARDRPSRPRARLRPGPLEGGRALPGRHALRHQRGPRQPPGPDPPHPRGLRLRAPAVGPDPPLRRLAQHLQGRDARGGRQAGARSTSTARGRRGRGGRGTPGCPTASAPSASRC